MLHVSAPNNVFKPTDQHSRISDFVNGGQVLVDVVDWTLVVKGWISIGRKGCSCFARRSSRNGGCESVIQSVSWHSRGVPCRYILTTLLFHQSPNGHISYTTLSTETGLLLIIGLSQMDRHVLESYAYSSGGLRRV